MRTIALPLAAAFLAALFIIAPFGTEPETASSETSPELARLNAQLAALQGQVHRLGDAQRGTTLQVRNLADGQEPASDEPAGLEDEGPARGERAEADEVAALERASAQVELLEHTLGQEKVDPAWGPWAEGELMRTLGQLDGASEIAAQCTATLCRMELAFETARAQEQSIERLGSLTPWDGQGFLQMDRESLELVLYIARDGESLPRAG